MLRPMEQGSLRVQGLQVGDVMVHPKERGAFTRKGIFYQITHPYLAEHIVEADETRLPSGPKAVLGFGFPTIRHMILGEKLKFYKPSGAKIMQLAWAAEAAPRNPWWTVRLTEHDVSVADRLYSEMKASLPQYLIPVRNAQWVNARFVDHPTHHYVIFALRHRMTQRVAALMVVRERADHLEWIDFVGGREHIDLCLTSLRRHAHALGKAKVQTWLSSWVSDVFNLQSPVVEDTGIVVPTNSHPESAFSEQLSTRLWLMTGDTDFR